MIWRAPFSSFCNSTFGIYEADQKGSEQSFLSEMCRFSAFLKSVMDTARGTKMNQVTLLHRNQKQLKYQKDSEFMYVGDERIVISSRTRKDVLWLLLSAFGRTVSYEEIAKALGGETFEEPNQRAAKFMSDLRASLNRTLAKELILTVRNQGYTIGPEWFLPQERIPVKKSNEFIGMLDNIIADCIQHVEDRQIVTCKNGLQFLDFDIQFATQKFQILNTMLWDTIRLLSHSSKPSELFALKNDFYELSTYILFWRVGERLEESKWKEDYRDEIRTKSRDIHRRVEELLKHVD